MRKLQPGDQAPPFTLRDQDGGLVESAEYLNKRLLIYFFCEVDSPSAVRLACALRDAKVLFESHEVQVIGISPDKPERHKKFGTRFELDFPLLSDPELVVAKAFGAWGEKAMFGESVMEIVQSFFLVSPKGRVETSWIDVNQEASVGAVVAHLDSKDPDEEEPSSAAEPEASASVSASVTPDDAFSASLTLQGKKLGSVFDRISSLEKRMAKLDQMEQDVLALSGILNKTMLEMKEQLSMQRSMTENVGSKLQLMSVTVDTLCSRIEGQDQQIGLNETRAEKFRSSIGGQLSLLEMQMGELTNELQDFSKKAKSMHEELERAAQLNDQLATFQEKPLMGVEEKMSEFEQRILNQVQKTEGQLRNDVKTLAKIITQNILNHYDSPDTPQ